MRFLYKSYIIVIIVFSIIYLTGCSSTEQTTGKLAFQQGDFQKAETEFLKEVSNNPQNEEAWFYLGATRLRLNKLTEAQEAFDKYRAIGKNSFQNEIVNEWEKIYDAAYKSYESARSDTSSSEIAIENRIKYYNDAISKFRTAYVILPDSSIVLKNISALNEEIANLTITPYINNGADLLSANKFAEAVEKFESAKKFKITKTNPKFYILQFNTALAYIKWAGAIRDSLAVVNSDDKSYQEKYRLAIPYLEELTTSSSKEDQYNGWLMLVEVYANLNMINEAKDAIKKRDELKAELGK